jgi:hypothetical protein
MKPLTDIDATRGLSNSTGNYGVEITKNCHTLIFRTPLLA